MPSSDGSTLQRTPNAARERERRHACDHNQFPYTQPPRLSKKSAPPERNEKQALAASGQTSPTMAGGSEHPPADIASTYLERRTNRCQARHPRARVDRKSVVYGNVVSVRVDIGGRSIIKKKN